MLEPQDFPITEFPRNTGEGMEEYSRKCQLAQFVTRHTHWKGETTQNEQQHAGHPHGLSLCSLWYAIGHLA